MNKIKIILAWGLSIISTTVYADERTYSGGSWGVCSGIEYIYSATEYAYPENTLNVGDGSIFVNAIGVLQCQDQFGTIVGTELCGNDLSSAPQLELKSPSGSKIEDIFDSNDGVVGFQDVYFAEGSNIGSLGPATCDANKMYIQSSNPTTCEKSYYIADYDQSALPAPCEGANASVSAPIMEGSCKLNGTSFFVDDALCPQSKLISKDSPAGTATNRSISHGIETKTCDAAQTTGTVTARTCDSGYYDFEGGCNQFISVATGMEHTCAISNSGAAYCWGRNTAGQLGNGNNTESNSPIAVQSLTSGVSDISAGGWNSCAIQNGAAKCWGGGEAGQLGDGLNTTSSLPVNVSGLPSGVSQIATGSNHSCAIHNGAAKCWGYSENRAIGHGSIANAPTPAQVIGLTSGVSKITAGGNHSCAIHNGAAKCWGYNSEGQLGKGDQVPASSPANVSGLTSGVSTISAGAEHTCAVHNGAAKCWGSNSRGQLGDNSYSTRVVPTNINLGAFSLQ